MGDNSLQILTGLIIVTALAVVALSDDKKEEKKEVKKEAKKEVKVEKDDEIQKLYEYFKKNISSKKRPKRHRIAYDSRGKTMRDKRGRRLQVLTSNSK